MKTQELYKNGGLSSAVLKWIAILSMVIDHFGAGYLAYTGQFVTSSGYNLYQMSRFIGRLAFPIFAFLIIQGYQHTSNRRKYVGQLILFGLLSEIPFDLAFYNQTFYIGHQNIFFTLAIGIIGFILFEKFELEENTILQMASAVIAALLAEILHVDYGLYGILFLFGLGMLRNNKIAQTLFGVIMGLVQGIGASLAFILIWFYNGNRGRQNKWVFYIFYPAHLLLVYLIRLFIT